MNNRFIVDIMDMQQENGRIVRLCLSLWKTTIVVVHFAHASPSTGLLERVQLRILKKKLLRVFFEKTLRSAKGKRPKSADAVRLSGKGKRHLATYNT